MHLDRIDYLRNYSKCWFSEHSNSDVDDLKISISSLMYNVKYIERHFTILPKDKTKDGIVS